mgnify:FL=1
MSVGGGGGTTTRQIDPVYRETPQDAFSWMRPDKEMLGGMGKDIMDTMGYNFGQRNLFGAGIQQDATMDEMIRQALGKSKLVNRGQWMNPGAMQETQPGWSVGLTSGNQWGV